MKKGWILLGFVFSFAQAESPKIDMPLQPPDETTAQGEAGAPASQPISSSVPDPKDTKWKEYDNRIVKAHARISSSWTLMEVKETQQSGSVSFTLSRRPFATFAITREPLAGNFELYVSSESLTPLYTSGYKKAQTVFAGRKAVVIRGITRDGRLDESYFSTDGHSIFQVSFSAPEGFWKEVLPQFSDLKESFRWLP